MAKLETVVVVRKDHPEGKVTINKSDMTDKDVIWTAEQPKKPVLRRTRKAK